MKEPLTFHAILLSVSGAVKSLTLSPSCDGLKTLSPISECKSSLDLEDNGKYKKKAFQVASLRSRISIKPGKSCRGVAKKLYMMQVQIVFSKFRLIKICILQRGLN